MIERDFIKTAAILSMRSKGATAPITRAEFIGQWALRLQNVAAAVWDEVKKAQQEKPSTPAHVVDLQRKLKDAGAIHQGIIERVERGSRLHRYMLEGDPLILEIMPDDSIVVYRPVLF